MRWEIERWVKLFRRDTAEWMLVPWRARGLFAELLRKAALDGSIECGRLEPDVAVVTLIGGVRDDVTEVRHMLETLQTDGCIVDVPAAGNRGRHLLIRNYKEAQDGPSTGAQRTRKWRKRRLELEQVTGGDGETYANNERRQVTPEEQKQEQKQEQKKEEASSEAVRPVASRAKESPTIATLRCVGAANFDVTEAMCLDWQRAFPAVNVREQVLRAVQWIEDNPDRRKTARGARSYLNRWLARQQDSGPRGATFSSREEPRSIFASPTGFGK